MTMISTVPKRGVFTSFALMLVSMMLSGQTWAFDVGGFRYATTSRKTVQVPGRAPGNTDTDIVIPATASDGSTTYKITTIGEDQRKH
jgi:hypothetical protein